MEQTQTSVTQQTGVKVSQAVGLALVLLSGVAGGAAMLNASSQFNAATKVTNTNSSSTTNTNTNTSAAADLSGDAIPPKELLTTTSTATTSTVTLDPSVSVRITSPAEGAAVNGDATVTAELTDPNHAAAGVRILLYGAMLPDYMQGVASSVDTTSPYTFPYNLGLYPSGEYRYVAQAVKFDPSIPGADTSVVMATSDTMVTWVRNCYYLAYQDMVLNPPTTVLRVGQPFTLTGTVKNNMRGNCQNIYDLSATTNAPDETLPYGWTATFNPTSLNLGIGQTGQFTMTIQPQTTLGNNSLAGTYRVGATSRRRGTGFVVTKYLDVNIQNPTDGSTKPRENP